MSICIIYNVECFYGEMNCSIQWLTDRGDEKLSVCKIREGETERIEIKKKLKKLKRGRDRW